MIRALRLLLLVFTTLGTLVIGAMWAVFLLPVRWTSFSPGNYCVDPQIGLVSVKVDFRRAIEGLHLVSKSGSALVLQPVYLDSSSFGNVELTGFGFAVIDAGGIAKQVITIPHWMAFAVFAAYPTFVAFRRYRRWRMSHREGCCRECGYDLTGNESGICPECGKPVQTRPGANQP